GGILCESGWGHGDSRQRSGYLRRSAGSRDLTNSNGPMWLKRSLGCCLTGVVLLTPSHAFPRMEVEELAAKFDHMNRRINNGLGYCASLNTTGELAWGESYVLRAYLEMYRATRDTGYLDSFIEHFDRVLANRDNIRHARDYYRKTALASWGSNEYSGNHW